MNPWDPERDMLLRELWNGGRYSAREIANIFNSKFGSGFTKSSIVGHARRIGCIRKKSPIKRGYSTTEHLTAEQRKAIREANLAKLRLNYKKKMEVERSIIRLKSFTPDKPPSKWWDFKTQCGCGFLAVPGGKECYGCAS